MSVIERASDHDADTLARVAGDDFSAGVIFSDLNQRIQVLDYEGPRLDAMVAELTRSAERLGYGKVFLKAATTDRLPLQEAGMEAEATISGYFAGADAVVMSAFIDEARRQRPFLTQQNEILDAIRSTPADDSLPGLPAGYLMSRAGTAEAAAVAQLYQEVFASYPFPITDPGYVAATLKSHVVYRIIRDGGGRLVAAASAETDGDHSNAEMTDFATLPDQRGLGLAQHLLAALEQDMAARRITNLYTVARARSAGMNRVFYNRGYQLTGTLVNNCHIAGGFEDMHVWCKGLTS